MTWKAAVSRSNDCDNSVPATARAYLRKRYNIEAPTVAQRDSGECAHVLVRTKALSSCSTPLLSYSPSSTLPSASTACVVMSWYGLNIQ